MITSYRRISIYILVASCCNFEPSSLFLDNSHHISWRGGIINVNALVLRINQRPNLRFRRVIENEQSSITAPKGSSRLNMIRTRMDSKRSDDDDNPIAGLFKNFLSGFKKEDSSTSSLYSPPNSSFSPSSSPPGISWPRYENSAQSYPRYSSPRQSSSRYSSARQSYPRYSSPRQSSSRYSSPRQSYPRQGFESTYQNGQSPTFSSGLQQDEYTTDTRSPRYQYKTYSNSNSKSSSSYQSSSSRYIRRDLFDVRSPTYGSGLQQDEYTTDTTSPRYQYPYTTPPPPRSSPDRPLVDAFARDLADKQQRATYQNEQRARILRERRRREIQEFEARKREREATIEKRRRMRREEIKAMKREVEDYNRRKRGQQGFGGGGRYDTRGSTGGRTEKKFFLDFK